MSRWLKINEFLVLNAEGKIQSAFGSFPSDAYFDARENCRVEVNLEIVRGKQMDCGGRDIYEEPTRRRYVQFRLTYDSPTPHQIFRMLAYKEGAITSPTGTPANEVQTLTRSGTVSGGSFPLSLTNFEGRSGTSKPIAWNASNAAILDAITSQAASLGKIIQPGDVAVTGDWGSGIVLTYGKRLRNANLPLLTVGAGVTGGGSIQIAQTTAGGQNYHTAQRTDDASKVFFGLALGNKASAAVTKKYGNCSVDSVNFTIDAEQTNIQMVVVVNCQFLPESFTSFSVPACTNLPPVLAVDVRQKIDGSFKHRELVNLGVNFSDNVPMAAAFGFDDIDMSVPPVAGKEPTQEITTEIFYDHADASVTDLRQLALEEFVEGNQVEYIVHFGNPGNRVTLVAPETKIKPQQQLDGFSGEAEQSTIKIIGTPHGRTGLPYTVEAYLDADYSFLETEA